MSATVREALALALFVFVNVFFFLKHLTTCCGLVGWRPPRRWTPSPTQTTFDSQTTSVERPRALRAVFSHDELNSLFKLLDSETDKLAKWFSIAIDIHIVMCNMQHACISHVSRLPRCPRQAWSTPAASKRDGCDCAVPHWCAALVYRITKYRRGLPHWHWLLPLKRHCRRHPIASFQHHAPPPQPLLAFALFLHPSSRLTFRCGAGNPPLRLARAASPS